MADTFSNDLRLRLQESGSNAGTWGDLLNGTITNIASALGQGSEAIPNASSHTITLADGTADEARSLYLKCTGGGQACTVTLGPNTISKVWIIDNATSYTLTFSQGSGASVAIAAGAVKVIATDGAGSGAAVVDTLDGLEGSLSTLAVTGALTVDTNTLVVDATNNRVGIGGTPATQLFVKSAANAANVFAIESADAAQRLQFGINTSNGGSYIFEQKAQALRFGTSDTERMRLDTKGGMGLGVAVNAGWTTDPILQVGPFAMASRATSASSLTDLGQLSTNQYWDGSNHKYIATGNSSMYTQNDGTHIFAGAPSGSAGGNITYVTGMTISATGSVGIGTSSPSTAYKLHLAGDNTMLRMQHTGSGGNGYFDLNVDSTVATINANFASSAIDFRILTGATERFRISSTGKLGLGVSAPQSNLDIDVAVDTSLGLRSQTGVIVAQYTGAPAVGNRCQIGLGYGNTYTNVSIGAVRTSATAYGTDDFIIATKAGTADAAPTERIRINSAGLLLHGTTAQISACFHGTVFNGTNFNGHVLKTTRSATGSNFAVFLNSSNQVAGAITHNGSTTVNYGASSDQRLKSNIADADDSGSIMDAIQVRKFDWIDGGAHEKYGFIAQELNNVLPNAVSSMGLPDEEDPMLGVDPSKLVPMLVKEIQSLRARVAKLEA